MRDTQQDFEAILDLNLVSMLLIKIVFMMNVASAKRFPLHLQMLGSCSFSVASLVPERRMELEPEPQPSQNCWKYFS